MRDAPITTANLSRWLRRAGTLPRGAVVGVQVQGDRGVCIGGARNVLARRAE